MTQHELRKRIGFVPQKSSLFSGTIESNLRFGNENAPEELLYKAAEIAQATEFIEAKPEKMDAEISQGGTTLVTETTIIDCSRFSQAGTD